MAEEVGAELGYQVFEHTLASGRRATPHPEARGGWMRPLAWRGTSHALFLDSERALPARALASARYQTAQKGRWSLAVLSRLPVDAHHYVGLPKLRRDTSQRGAIVVSVEGLTVVGTHMSHLTYGSPSHFAQLATLLDGEIGAGPGVLAGDMNLWGPPVRAFLPRWRQAVRGRTWPAWRPHSQLDHILVRGALEVRGSAVIPMTHSDHRPVRVVLAIPEAGPAA
jgi:endonuclease/exonuclease/phosphatase family metal-dependent hydrolase